MTKKLTKTKATKVLGVAGSNTKTGTLRADEFLPELKGTRAIKKFREMRDNDSTIGAVMYATEQVLRDVKFKVVPSIKDDSMAVAEAEFVEQVFEDMDHTLDDHVSEALSFLTYGFGWFETVYKRRVGPYEKNPKKNSKYTDGRFGIRKIASRAPWTINRFDIDKNSGDVYGVYQSSSVIGGDNYLPTSKSVYYRTTAINGDASGRSILRNAYQAYERLKSVQDYEAIGIERELAGIPVGRIPADYLSPDATDDQKVFVEDFKRILRDVKFNEQGFLLLPSDLQPSGDDKLTSTRLVDINLMSSDGTRQIDLDPVIRRYQHDIARSILSEFIMLGSSSNGSYALSKSKTDLFLRGLESYIQTIADVLNKQVIESLWRLNGLDFKYMPKIVAGDVAPHDLKELGSYLRNLNGAGIPIRDQVDIVKELVSGIPELPDIDEEVYNASLEQARLTETARNDYYDNDKESGRTTGSSKDQNDEDEVG